MKITLKARAKAYNEAFPQFPDSHLHASSKWIQGTWIMGNDYKGSGYYGSYPPGYLKRINALFPELQDEKTKALHLFSGSLEPGNYVRFDKKEELKPDICGDAHELSSFFTKGYFDIIFADPPYSEECAKHYGTPMVKRKIVLEQCLKVLKKGGFLVWMDQVIPIYSKARMKWCGAISVWRSTNHRIRGIMIYKRTGGSTKKTRRKK